MMTLVPPPPPGAPPGRPGRPGRPGGTGQNLAGLLLALVALALVAAGFAVAISLDRAGSCHARLSETGGRPHYVMICGTRQP